MKYPEEQFVIGEPVQRRLALAEAQELVRGVKVAVSDSAHARRTDPVTSHEAAASVEPEKMRASQAYLLAIIKDYAHVTDEELWGLYVDRSDGDRRMGGNPPKMTVSGMRTRRSELVAKKKVRDSGLRRHTATGRRTIAWEAVP